MAIWRAPRSRLPTKAVKGTPDGLVEAALNFVGLRPAALACAARLRAVGAADRGVPTIVELVVGDVVVDDVAPDVLLRPVGQRIGLPELVLLVPLELGGPRAHRGLLAAEAGDPAVDVRQG